MFTTLYLWSSLYQGNLLVMDKTKFSRPSKLHGPRLDEHMHSHTGITLLFIEMRKALINISLGVLCFSMLPTLDFWCCADECLHADLALNTHCLLVCLQLTAFGCLVFFIVFLAGHLGLLSIAATHGWLNQQRETILPASEELPPLFFFVKPPPDDLIYRNPRPESPKMNP